jgi:hypothetical protein
MATQAPPQQPGRGDADYRRVSASPLILSHAFGSKAWANSIFRNGEVF